MLGISINQRSCHTALYGLYKHIVVLSICTPSFTSSDWSIPVFVTGQVKRDVTWLGTFLAAKKKDRQKVGGQID